MAIRDLGITWFEVQDKTIFEITIELEGYQSRWEEKWRHTRLIGTLLYNQQPGPEGQLKEYQFLTLPSEVAQTEWDNYVNSMEFSMRLEQEK